MSTEYWPIIGYGIEFDYDFLVDNLDLKKLGPAIITDTSGWDQSDIDILHYGTNSKIYDLLNDADIYRDEIIDFICEGSKILGRGDTGDLYDEAIMYLMFHANLPWEYNMYYKDKDAISLTKEAVQEEIIKVLTPYLKDEIDTLTIRNMCERISAAGCG
jgi:hypothetical protein